MKSKYIFVIGGVMSGVGKGIATSSLGLILKSKGYKVSLVKADPYLNVDAGTMNPTEHGEVFVMKEGLETDQDMGNYERFLHQDIAEANYMTSGMVYKTVIDRERSLGYGGKCVEAIPHVRDEIIQRYEEAAKENKSDITIVEIGGTIGDYQNVMFMEAAKTMKLRNPKDVIVIVVSYVPVPNAIGENLMVTVCILILSLLVVKFLWIIKEKRKYQFLVMFRLKMLFQHLMLKVYMTCP
jgi:CTP synthase